MNRFIKFFNLASVHGGREHGGRDYISLPTIEDSDSDVRNAICEDVEQLFLEITKMYLLEYQDIKSGDVDRNCDLICTICEYLYETREIWFTGFTGKIERIMKIKIDELLKEIDSAKSTHSTENLRITLMKIRRLWFNI